MNNKSILKRIKSKYIYKIIFDYINNENFKLKLFNYSKYFQNILGLKLFDYKEKFFDNLDINLNDYFYKDSCKIPMKKPLLKQMLENDLKEYKLDFNFIQKYLINSLNKKIKALIDKFKNKASIFSDLYINISSPFFDFISQSEIFEFFGMRIFIDKINLFVFKEDLISFINNLNISSKISSLVLFYKKPCEIDYLEEYKIKINFEGIKKLQVILQFEPYSPNIYDNNYFYKTLFSFDNFGKNLLYLDINLKHKENIDLNIINYLNNFKLLEILILSYFAYFAIDSLFTIKFYNLITLKLLYCGNITLSENCGLNIKTVSFCYCRFPKSNFLLKLPEAKDCQIYGCASLMIDYESLSKIKNLTIDVYYF